MRVEIVGPYSPDLGGIQSHISRLKSLLDKNSTNYLIYNHGYGKFDNVISNNKRAFWYIKFLFKKNSNLIHFHQTLKGWHYFYWFLFSFLNSSRIIITLHNEELLYQCKTFRLLNLFLLSKTKYLALFVVSDKIFCFLKNKKLKVEYLPAYVPIEEGIEIENLGSSLHKEYFLASVYKLTKKNYSDIYGLDIVLELLDKLKASINLVLLIGNEKESDIDFFLKILKQKELENSVELVFNKSLPKYMKNAKFFLRPNRKDGYGISLQESIDLNTFAISTNICKRPDGVFLFNTDRFEELEKIVNRILVFSDEEKRIYFSKIEKPKYHLELLSYYQSIINNEFIGKVE